MEALSSQFEQHRTEAVTGPRLLRQLEQADQQFVDEVLAVHPPDALPDRERVQRPLDMLAKSKILFGEAIRLAEAGDLVAGNASMGEAASSSLAGLGQLAGLGATDCAPR